MKEGGICHVEIRSKDLEKTKGFLEGVFGWEFHDVGNDYWIYTTPEGVGGGLVQMHDAGDGAVVYILSEEIEDTLVRIEEAGGHVEMPKTSIDPPPGGPPMWISQFRDPAGVRLALYQGPV